MKFIPKLWAERTDQKHVNNSSRLVLAPGANYANYGGGTCHVHVKVDHAVTETTDKNNLRSTHANFK